jgi:hypothetical protein
LEVTQQAKRFNVARVEEVRCHPRAREPPLSDGRTRRVGESIALHPGRAHHDGFPRDALSFYAQGPIDTEKIASFKEPLTA